MRLATILGTRPQFIKAAPVSAELRRRNIEEILIHTGQHYDRAMSDVFFTELGLPEAQYDLEVGSAAHGAQTGEIMKRLEPLLDEIAPDAALVYGDTNSTLAGALTASKLGIPVVHVEAGLRSFDRTMPEEINRIVSDHVSDVHLAPTENAALQLAREGIVSSVVVVGDVMADLAAQTASSLPELPDVLRRFGLVPGTYGVVTVHRAGNTNDPVRFANIVSGLRAVGLPLIFPVHPRTRALVDRYRVGMNDRVIACEPLGYRDTIALLSSARVVFTDSGGIQKEAFAVGVPCVTLRGETEWIETLEGGWNVLADCDPEAIVRGAGRARPSRRGRPFGDGNAAVRSVDAVVERFERTRDCVSVCDS